MSRSARRSPGRARAANRVENDARVRRERARTHYSRIREQRRTQRTRRLAGAAAFGLSCLLGVVAGHFQANGLFDALEPSKRHLTRIAVLGASRLAPAEVAAAAGIARGSVLAEVDPASISARVTAHPWIREAAALRAPGGALVVRVSERVPVARLASRDGGERYVEADGTPFAPVDAATAEDDAGLLRLRAATQLENDVPQPLVREALSLARSADEHGLGRPASIGLPDGAGSEGWVMRFEEPGPEILLGSVDRPQLDARLARLAQLRAARPDDVRAAARIDLRFRERAILRAADGSASAPSLAPSARGSEPAEHGETAASAGGLETAETHAQPRQSTTQLHASEPSRSSRSTPRTASRGEDPLGREARMDPIERLGGTRAISG